MNSEAEDMVTPMFNPNYPNFRVGRNALLSTIERTGASSTYTGQGVVIAFIDSGFFPHPDLSGRILLHVDASTNHVLEQPAIFESSDLSWHGQMTSVIACGDGSSSQGKYRGIASGANLILVKVSTPRGQIKEADILRGLRWVLDTYKRLNIRVVNISLGGDFISTNANHPLHKSIRKLTREGVTVVVAAGNRNVPHLLPPASAAEAITVGGVDDQNSLDQSHWKLYHHNYGQAYDGSPKPDLVAPANWLPSPIMPGSSVEREARWLAPLLHINNASQITDLLRQGSGDLGLLQTEIAANEQFYNMIQSRIHTHKLIDEHHQHVDGTSVAAPIVSAVIAQMIEANPGLTPRQIRAILTGTATRLPNYPLEQQGSGILNAGAAVQAALQSPHRTGKNTI